jgi:hypothetical protein
MESDSSYTKWAGVISAGAYFSIDPLLVGGPYDELVEYADETYYVQLLCLQYFFSPTWGVEASYRGSGGFSSRSSEEQILEPFEARYRDKYFVESSSSLLLGASRGPLGDIQRAHIGLVARFPMGRFVAMPKMTFGLTNYYSNNIILDLKARGANIYERVTIDAGSGTEDRATFGSGLGLVWTVNDDFSAQFDLGYRYFQSGLVFEERRKDLVSGEIQRSSYDMRTGVHSLAIGLGLRVDF